MRPVAVYDTNVLFSALGWRGIPYHCLELARNGSVVGVTCREILAELEEKLQTKAGFSSSQASEAVVGLLSFLRVVKITGTLKVVTADPDDDKILECAVAGGASHVITGDRRHLIPLGAYQGISIVTPAEFVALVAHLRK